MLSSHYSLPLIHSPSPQTAWQDELPTKAYPLSHAWHPAAGVQFEQWDIPEQLDATTQPPVASTVYPLSQVVQDVLLEQLAQLDPQFRQVELLRYIPTEQEVQLVLETAQVRQFPSHGRATATPV